MSSNIDSSILALLRDGRKHYNEIKKKLVPSICSNQTLSKHLKELGKGKKIERTTLSDRTTVYEVMPGFQENAKRAYDSYSLEQLLTTLQDSIIDERFDLIKAKEASIPMKYVRSGTDQEKFVHYIRQISAEHAFSLKNFPELRFSMYLDGIAKSRLDLFSGVENATRTFKDEISSQFADLKKKIPPTDKDIDMWESRPIVWNITKSFLNMIREKYGFRYLVYSWFDGKDYSLRISKALKELEKLERGHQDNIEFLDEINNRYYYAGMFYHFEEEFIWKEILSNVFEGVNLTSVMEDSFVLYCQGKERLCALEAALVSESTSAFERNVPLEESFDRISPDRSVEDKVPYKIIEYNTFLKMKFQLLSEAEKKILLGKVFSIIKQETEKTQQSVDELSQILFWFPPYEKDPKKISDKIRQNTEYLTKELGITFPNSIANEKPRDPIFNFKFFWQGQIIDLSKDPLVAGFLEFLKEGSNKRLWLQDCLDTGVPIYPEIPFETFNFRRKQIV